MAKLVHFDADKERHLKCGFKQMKEIQEEALRQKNESKVVSNIESMVDIFYILLKWQDKNLTHDDVFDIMDAALEKHDMKYIEEKMKEAMSKFSEGEAIPTEK